MSKQIEFDTSMFQVAPVANEKAVVKSDKYRFTVLTSRLIRLEWAEDGVFNDLPTRLVMNRNLPVPKFTVKETEESLEILTEHLHLYYDKKPFSQGLSIAIIGMTKHKCTKWHYGMKDILMMKKDPNLGGTTETLDMIDGECKLERGLISRHGFAVLDDHDTMTMDENGWFSPYNRGNIDLYFFGYLEDSKACIRDFYRVSGPMPMVSRYQLGNWWSRYYKYTEKTYTDLMKEFAAHKVPLAVSVIDMDWHITEPPKQYGNGWTGWTWNRDFFPDPERFLQNLHKDGLHVTMNIHPGDGIRAFEDCYEDCAKAMGVDPKTEMPLTFDASSPAYMKAWMEHCLTPLENQGVDFWWIDWQQYDGTEKDGFDVMFMLNHYLYVNNCKNGQKGSILSRYAGLGSHRYPLGFSGDTIMTWDSLKFQPYFTLTASNAGYSWWSHDIGGHKMGEWSDDMQVRWCQYGLYSPIYRPHSGKDVFFQKEPWNFPKDKEEIIEDIMRFRHALIPYLYTMAYANSAEGIPLVRPMYFEYPKMKGNDIFRNQYFFGSELLVFPITEKMNEKSLTGSVDAWIPAGDWFDFYTGRHYTGEKTMKLYRQLQEYPVFAKAGAIVPLADDGCVNGAPLPKNLLVKAFAGANGEFRLYEDNENTKNHKECFTPITLKWGEKAVLTKKPAEGTVSVAPKKRNFTFELFGINCPKKVTVKLNGAVLKDVEAFTYDEKRGVMSVKVMNVLSQDTVEVIVLTDGALHENDYKAEIQTRLARYQCSNDTKAEIQAALDKSKTRGALLSQLPYAAVDSYILGELVEITSSAL